MTATWMLYSLLTGALVAGAAWGAEGICRLAGRPARWVWAAAMGLTLALAALAPGRTPPEPLAATAVVTTVEVGEVDAAPPPAPGLSLAAARRAVESALRGALAAAGSRAPRALDLYLAALWAGSAAVLLGVIGSTHHRFRRRRRRWPTSELHGTRVRVAPDLGPAVVGVGRAEIVVPRWFLELPVGESRLVLEHEREHLRARDPLLLALAWTAAALLAWNPALWWMLSRLRLAVELDCDARVLRGGADRLSYGTVLIELAGRSSRLRPGMLALADPPSQLERRLLAMTSRRIRFAAARAALLGTVAGTALLAACAAELPTAAQIQALDVERAEKAAEALAIVDGEGTIYTLDGVVVTPAQARALAPGAIAEVRVEKSAVPGEAARIAITSVNASRGEVVRAAAPSGIQLRSPAPDGVSAEPTPGTRIRALGVTGEPQPLYIIDGTVVEPTAARNPLADLDPATVESISVLKDASATEQYGARGANGVVIVTTRRGPGGVTLAPDDARRASGIASVAVSENGMTRAEFDAALAKASPEVTIWVVDGARVDRSAALALDPSEVLRVIIGSATSALRETFGAEAENGLVQIATKRRGTARVR